MPVTLPRRFCWTKMGTEAGEDLRRIIQRKEAERAAGAGLFCWGIGNSVVPGVGQLAALEDQPEVLFSPMSSAAKDIDRRPASLWLWLRFVDPQGVEQELPEHVVITSRVVPGSTPRHYALFCHSPVPLADTAGGEIPVGDLANLGSGKPLGASQVTCMAEYLPWGNPGRRYPVSFRARLVAPFAARLARPVRLSPTLREEMEGIAGAAHADRMRWLAKVRASVPPSPEQLGLV